MTSSPDPSPPRRSTYHAGVNYAAVVRRREAGETARAIAREYGVSIPAISQGAKRNGFVNPQYGGGRPRRVNHADIVADAAAGLGRKRIAYKYGLTVQCVGRIINAHASPPLSPLPDPRLMPPCTSSAVARPSSGWRLAPGGRSPILPKRGMP